MRQTQREREMYIVPVAVKKVWTHGPVNRLHNRRYSLDFDDDDDDLTGY